MALKARQAIVCGMNSIDCVHNIFMASAAIGLDYAAVACGYGNLIGIPARRKIKRMPKTIVGFCGIFSQDIMGRVAVVANGHRVMRGLNPTVIFFVHDMAIGAHLRFIAHVRNALGINEGVKPDPHKGSQRNRKTDKQRSVHSFEVLMKRKRKKGNLAETVLDAKTAARPVAVDVIEGTQHAASAAFNTVFVINDNCVQGYG